MQHCLVCMEYIYILSSSESDLLSLSCLSVHPVTGYVKNARVDVDQTRIWHSETFNSVPYFTTTITQLIEHVLYYPNDCTNDFICSSFRYLHTCVFAGLNRYWILNIPFIFSSFSITDNIQFTRNNLYANFP